MSKYVMKKDGRGEWRWTYRANNGEPIAVSSEGYVRRDDCLYSISLLKNSANDPVVEE